MKSNVYLASKPRYEILDGLRGVAAVLVVAYHLFETYYHGGTSQPINHGYLAVDFFFVLSGLDRMSTWGFVKRRLIRLHPMVIFGSLFGAALFYFGDCSSFPLIGDTPWYKTALIMLWAFTMIPIPTSMDIRGWGETNPLNGPAWSLQWEYLANFLYAVLFRHFSRKALGACVVLFGIMTLVLCLNIDIFGFLAARSSASYTVIGGWCLSPDQLQIGLTRLLYRWCSAMIVVLLCMPWMGLGPEGNARWTNGLYEAACILVFFPLIVSIGAGSSVKGSTSESINKFLGDISFPLYITHYPLIYMQMAWANSHKYAPTGTHIFVAVSTFLLAILIAYGAYRLYDLPVREWLKKQLFKPATPSDANKTK